MRSRFWSNQVNNERLGLGVLYIGGIGITIGKVRYQKRTNYEASKFSLTYREEIYILLAPLSPPNQPIPHNS